ncbi:DUF4942 domain-containing protein [Pseudomonas sp. PSB11]|uniref:DUF4942 domain-containing protein n=1 Tax=Pseudomonas sp. PSB11 TaxID=2021969 RepID=UPI00397F7020
MGNFQTGTRHINFKRPSLIDKMNDLVAKHYPALFQGHFQCSILPCLPIRNKDTIEGAKLKIYNKTPVNQYIKNQDQFLRRHLACYRSRQLHFTLIGYALKSALQQSPLLRFALRINPQSP